jgi:hypothetical protein
MIKPAKIVELMGLNVGSMSTLLNKTGYDGLGDEATLVFSGLNEDGHFTYRAKDFDVDEGEMVYFNLYVSYNHKDDTVEVSY